MNLNLGLKTTLITDYIMKKETNWYAHPAEAAITSGEGSPMPPPVNTNDTNAKTAEAGSKESNPWDQPQWNASAQVPNAKDAALIGGVYRPLYDLETEKQIRAGQWVPAELIQGVLTPLKKEVDPYGNDATKAGAKLDYGKTKVDLVLGDFSRALEEVAKVGTFGASKYSESGWLSVPEGIKRYADAGGRHWLKRKQGEQYDKDSNLLHLAHEAWNILAELELQLRKNK